MKKIMFILVFLCGCFQSTKYYCTKTDLDKTLKIYEVCMKKVEDFVSVSSHKGVETFSLSTGCMQQAKELTCVPIDSK